MKNVRSLFNEKQNEMLEEIGVKLSDDIDYSDDELDDIYDTITEHYQVAAFDKNSDPLPIAKEWEEIVDIFFDETNR